MLQLRAPFWTVTCRVSSEATHEGANNASGIAASTDGSSSTSLRNTCSCGAPTDRRTSAVTTPRARPIERAAAEKQKQDRQAAHGLVNQSDRAVPAVAAEVTVDRDVTHHMTHLMELRRRDPQSPWHGGGSPTKRWRRSIPHAFTVGMSSESASIRVTPGVEITSDSSLDRPARSSCSAAITPRSATIETGDDITHEHPRSKARSHEAT
jgi:hypothetical protein